jgi:hypothetical protein
MSGPPPPPPGYQGPPPAYPPGMPYPPPQGFNPMYPGMMPPPPGYPQMHPYMQVSTLQTSIHLNHFAKKLIYVNIFKFSPYGLFAVLQTSDG